MAFLTNEKLTIVGAAGMIGSNMAQTALMMGLTSNLCLYDVFSPEGVAEEMRQCGFDGVNITATTDVKEAFTDAKYIISSGGAPRKAGMTREDLLKGNCEIAEQLGKDIKTYCPDVKHVVIIFNPADLTGLVTLLYSGLKPSQVTTLAALDSTRLQSALAKKFGVMQNQITGCATYGGHGEQMAVFGSAVKVAGKPLSEIIGTAEFPVEEWKQMQQDVTKGGAKIIELRGRSSFQSPSYLSVEMIRSAMGGEAFRWPAGTFVNNEKYKCIMMAMKTTLDVTGCHFEVPTGTADEVASLDASYEHLCKMRDELVTLYRALQTMWRSNRGKTGDDSFSASDIDIAQMCLAIDARTPVDERSVESGLGIFEELGFCRVSGFDDTRRIAMAENPGRVQLSRSIRYLEGLRSRMEFSAFRSWALDSCASDMLAKVNRPIVPRA